MKINTTFQLMDEIANIVAGPKPKVISNMAKTIKKNLITLFEMRPLKDRYIKTSEDHVNFVQFQIEGIPTYPIQEISILTGFEPNIQDYFTDEANQINAILLHPGLSIDSKQAIIMSDHFLRTSLELSHLMDIDKQTFVSNICNDYSSNMEKADNLLLVTSNSLKNLYSYLFSQTKELGIFQNQYSFDQPISFDIDLSNTTLTSSEVLNELILNAMVNVTIRKIYNLILSNSDKSLFVDKTIVFEKLFNNVYAQNFIGYIECVPSDMYYLWYEQYNIVVHELIDLFMDDSISDANIYVWLNLICKAYEKYEK